MWIDRRRRASTNPWPGAAIELQKRADVQPTDKWSTTPCRTRIAEMVSAGVICSMQRLTVTYFAR